MTESFIGTVRYSAPMFNKATLEELLAIVKLLSDASYHYADDSNEEWGRATRKLNRAAEAINLHKLNSAAIGYLHAHAPQLVTIERLLDAVLRGLRKPCEPHL